MKKLLNILKNVNPYAVSGDMGELEVAGIAYNSRRVKPGYVFVAIKGFHLDGHNFIEDALNNGATVIVTEREVPARPGILYIRVNDSREALAKLSEAFYDFPGKKLQIIGVTGTNGKTTTTYMVESILRHNHHTTGLVGTIRNKIGDRVIQTERTTPESSDLQELFAMMVETGATHAVMEVSSHALELKRVEDLVFTAGIFTNLTQDHLDFHETLENYKIAKGKLFHLLTEDGTGIVNIDDAAGEYMVQQCRKSLTYGIESNADIRATEIDIQISGVKYHVKTPIGETWMKLNFTGYFNVYNSLAAIATGVALGISLDVIKEGLESLAGVTGRFEQVSIGQPFGVIVDYAHTPDGMENVLKTAEEIVPGRKIVVFGAGGDRDRTKRPLMGQVAARYSDLAILTADNPRSEDINQILTDIEKGILDMPEKVNYLVIPDRREAIFWAVQEAKPGECVIILGKGHETYQVLKDETIPFDDREVAKEAIQSLREERL